MTNHACDGAPDYDGGESVIARCTCGWLEDGHLDIEDAIDALMEHVWDAGRSWAAGGGERTGFLDD